MFRGKKVVVVMPAYNAARTLKRTYDEVMAEEIVDLVIVVDDGSKDETVAVARTLPDVVVHVHPVNQGYGGNQKTCYRLALEAGGDIVIMIHPDYQYTPRLIPAMAAMIATGLYPCVLASRILGGYALAGRDALVEIPLQSFPHLGRESYDRREAVGVSHGLSGVLSQADRVAGPGVLLRRFHFRQPDAGANLVAGSDNRRDQLPHPI